MSFPKHAVYQESGVDWLGKVPSHWKLHKLKYISDIVGGGTPSRENLAYWNGDIPWVSPKDMKSESITDAEECITELGLENSSTSYQLPGRILMVIRSGILQHTLPVAINDVPVAINQDMKAFSFNESICNPRFFLRWVQGLNDILLLAWANEGATVESMNQTLLQDTTIPLPDIAEQKAIASFLDLETSKIDGLVSEQRRLIELLKEKRQAVISHAVTKGLNPNAPMKPSGIPWLGDVPEHWVVSRFGQLANVVRGGSPRPAGDPTLFNGDYSPWVTVAEITKDDEIDLTTTSTFLTEKGSRESRLFDKGTLLLTNSGGSLGVPKILRVDANANDGVLGFLDLSLNQHFAYFYLTTLTHHLRETVKKTGGSTQINLNTHLIKQLAVPIPPAEEAEKIAKLILQSRNQYRALEAEAERAIELLQERRTALISAAVTGKIDVRTFAPRESP